MKIFPLFFSLLTILLIEHATCWVQENTGTQETKKMAFVPVGNPGNRCDHTGNGTVTHVFSIGTYEVTAGEYCDFLNAVAQESDPYGLYHEQMSSDTAVASINRLGMSGSYIYVPFRGYENLPITYVTLYDAARFCNWLHNGKPHGKEDATTTESGAYDLHGKMEGTLKRNQEARYFLPTNNEWYKAAYYDARKKEYYDFPTRSNWSPKNSHNTDTDYHNEANYDNADTMRTMPEHPEVHLTPVSYFSTTMSPYGALDMAGNVAEWTESFTHKHSVIIRGGAWNTPYAWSGGSEGLEKNIQEESHPLAASNAIGFRVAQHACDENTPIALTSLPDVGWGTPSELEWGGGLIATVFGGVVLGEKAMLANREGIFGMGKNLERDRSPNLVTRDTSSIPSGHTSNHSSTDDLRSLLSDPSINPPGTSSSSENWLQRRQDSSTTNTDTLGLDSYHPNDQGSLVLVATDAYSTPYVLAPLDQPPTTGGKSNTTPSITQTSLTKDGYVVVRTPGLTGNSNDGNVATTPVQSPLQKPPITPPGNGGNNVLSTPVSGENNDSNGGIVGWLEWMVSPLTHVGPYLSYPTPTRPPESPPNE